MFEYLGKNMEYVVQAFKIWYTLRQTQELKNGIFCRFSNPNTISLRDYELILCMFGFLD